MIKVRIPTPLRPMTGGKNEVEISGSSVGEILENLGSAHPGIKERICDDQGEVRRFHQYLRERRRHPLFNGKRNSTKRR